MNSGMAKKKILATGSMRKTAGLEIGLSLAEYSEREQYHYGSLLSTTRLPEGLTDHQVLSTGSNFTPIRLFT